jgi:hypothetical protein
MTASVRYSRVASASAAPVTDYRTAKVDGVNVFYREAGPADAPVVLLLHGVHRIIGRSTTFSGGRLASYVLSAMAVTGPDGGSSG